MNNHLFSRVPAALLLLAALLTSAPAVRAAGTVIYERESAFGTVVVTDEGGGKRALRFGRNGVRQSLVKLDDPEYLELAYTPVALSGLALCAEPQRMLVLGLGGGTLPMFLRHQYPGAEIDVVDINPEVAAAAVSQLGFREDARMRIHITDGRKFIENTRTPYDAVFLDAFGANAVPPHLTTREFLAAVRRAVKPDGVVVGNLWSTATNPPYAAMVATYREVFETLHVLRVTASNNRILLATPRIDPPATLAERAGALSLRKRFRFDLGALVSTGLQPAGDAGSGIVLTDTALGL